ncbi:hypothetical protein OSB04_005104 [Centaurea solstitialis]|uniref:Uncharacterized protein n=1 Tax=Centaurea solstitialis TaxID=347529 RepID=A0AA38TH51_9ASTR|nr:hypothetical protein OSB04_005104 [Centaurea solstitialis]
MTSSSQEEHFNKHVALFVFGDSIFDPGNNNYINTSSDFQANFWPYGISYFDPPTGRFSDGRIIPDFIAEYAKLPLIPAYLDPRQTEFVYGANFASGGAGALVETFAGFAVNLKTQLEYFGDLEKHFRENLGDAKAEKLVSDAVYLFSCGGNDYWSPVGSIEQHVEMVIGNLTDVIKGIHGKGGRKFGMVTIPPSGCWPSIRARRPDNSCSQEIETISSLHNEALSKKFEELEKQLEGFVYSIFDLSTAISNRMNNPSRYGFKVGDGACCGSGPFGGIYSCGGKRGSPEFDLCDNASDHLFFDSNHLNEVASRQFAELWWKGDTKVASPYNLKHLFET